MRILRWWKQIWCKHEWKNKGLDNYETAYFISTERRCRKCKKVEYKQFYKH
jgi:hypothetical protein